MYTKILDWIENELGQDVAKDMIEDGFDLAGFFENLPSIDYNDVYAIFEAEIEYLLEEESIALDLESSLEYTKEMSNTDIFENDDEYRMNAFQQAVLIVARKRYTKESHGK